MMRIAGKKDEFDINSVGLSNEIMRFDAMTYVILSGPFFWWEAEHYNAIKRVYIALDKPNDVFRSNAKCSIFFQIFFLE